MTPEELNAKFAGVKAFTDGHKRLMLGAICLVVGFALGAVTCSSKAATITVTGTGSQMTDVAQCSTLTTVAQNQVPNLSVVCGTVIPPGPTPGPGCAGFNPSALEILWPATTNSKINAGFWPANTALVIHFKTGTVVGRSPHFNLVNFSGPNYIGHVASLSAAPGCNVVTAYPPVPPIMWAAASQTPTLAISVGVAKPGYVTVQPNTDYWITVVNRFPNPPPWPGQNTCPRPDCGAGVGFVFNTF